MTRHIALLLPVVVCLCASCQGPPAPEKKADPVEKAVQTIEALGFSREQVLRQSLITPACGLGTREPAAAARALELTRDLAADLATAI